MAGTSASVDAFGRVVIPKRARTRYGLDPGAMLEIEELPAGILLRPAGAEPTVRREGGVLVLTASAAGNLEDRVRLDRTERATRLTPRGRP